MTHNPLRVASAYFRSRAALRYAEQHGAPGVEFGRFGQMLGVRLLSRGVAEGARYVLAPVNITRYWEFAFARDCLPPIPIKCLDVSSPRLFGVFVATSFHDTHVLVTNPDVQDAGTTRAMATALGLKNLHVVSCSVEALSGTHDAFDCIWSLSVIEHIEPEDGDIRATALMYDALAPGGRLILTVPVDRQFWVEYRDRDYYNLRPPGQPGAPLFFQRLYDATTITSRIVNSIGVQPTVIRWFGERVAGRFAAYESDWMREGLMRTVADPREITDHYEEFSSWDEMPGMGVCGLMIEKHATHP